MSKRDFVLSEILRLFTGIRRAVIESIGYTGGLGPMHVELALGYPPVLGFIGRCFQNPLASMGVS